MTELQQQMLQDDYKEFCKMNAGWDNGCGCISDKDMRENFQIALDVINAFSKDYRIVPGPPQVGDIVEMSDGYRVYKHAQIESIDKYGVATICEQGHSFMGIDSKTGKVYFSTSGGAFVGKHISFMRRDGIEKRSGWTWGRYGAGYNQGIEFTFVVKKWKIPYRLESNVRIHFYNRKWADEHGWRNPIVIRNIDFTTWNFKNYACYKAWADYVGFDYDHQDLQPYAWGRRCLYRMVESYAWKPEMIPDGCKMVVAPCNGRMSYVFVHNDGETITTYRPSGDWGEKFRLKDDIETWRKYDGNPMGI